MTAMTDEEIVRKCAEKMGWKHLGAIGGADYDQSNPDRPYCKSGGNDWWLDPEGRTVCAPCSGIPDPLHDDAQAMALVKKFKLDLLHDDGEDYYLVGARTPCTQAAQGKDLNRAICECVAKL